MMMNKHEFWLNFNLRESLKIYKSASLLSMTISRIIKFFINPKFKIKLIQKNQNHS